LPWIKTLKICYKRVWGIPCTIQSRRIMWKKSLHSLKKIRQQEFGQQPKKLWMPIVGGLAIMSFGVGILVSITVKPGSDKGPNFAGLMPFGKNSNPDASNRIGASSPIVTPIVTQTPQQRAELLKKTAQTNSPSLDRNRARYLLASDLLTANKPKEALESLQDLEKDYKVLTAPILLQRAKAQASLQQNSEFAKTIQQLMAQHPKDPTTAEALALLGQQDKKYQEQLLSEFPAHPKSIELAKARLKQNPKQFPLQFQLAKYDLEAKDYGDRTEQFVQAFEKQLTPEQWEAVAFGLWENQKYGKAADAYAKAPATALTRYRSARGLHLSEKPGSRDRYQAVVQAFPGTPEAGLSLTRLISLAEKPQDAIAYADVVLTSYPDKAPQALLEKATALEKLSSTQAASQTRQTLLDQHSTSPAAAELRWTIAQKYAKANDFAAAKQWADAVITGNPQAELAPQAGFWAGKWAMKLGQSDDAASHFKAVLKARPESYYAWRSATFLGWKVGDFDSVRPLTPTIQLPKDRKELPTGSETLRELHQLGQAQDAWGYWQVEYQNRVKPTVSEQFTDGVMRLAVGDNLDGIFMVSHLDERTLPEEQKQVQSFKQGIGYWQALYPFPFKETIATWSKERQINAMLVTALIRQESRFEPKIQSSVGATGLMQIMPETAAEVANSLKVKGYKLENIDDNVKLGTAYLDRTHQEYQGNSMLAVASYNAGPGAVSGWVSKSKTQDADEFIETIPYAETQGYVKSVFANYWNYMRLYNPEIAQQVGQFSPAQPK
jgi:soluble lytic murein transglycosylase